MVEKSVLVLVVCLAVASAKVCIPTRYSATLFGKIAAYAGGKELLYTSMGMSYDDYEQQMQSLTQNLTDLDGKTSQVTYLTDWNNMKVYEVHASEQSCTVRDLPDEDRGKFKKICIGDDDLIVSHTLVIDGREALVLELDYANTTAFFTVMAEDFSPVSVLTNQNYEGIATVSALQYGNVTKPSVPINITIPSYCTHPKPAKARVCAPPQMEAVIVGRIAQAPSGKPMSLGTEIQLSRDQINKMEASFTNVDYEGTVIKSYTIHDYTKNKLYNYNPDKKTCKVSPPPAGSTKQIEFCSDNEDLHLIESFTVAGKEAGVYLYEPKEPAAFRVSVTVFKDTFLPITITTEQKVLGFGQLVVGQYGNITSGIKDPSVFNVPDYCMSLSSKEPVIG